MKTLILALVLATIGPAHVRIGPAVVPVLWLLAAAELAAVAGGAWLIVRCVRRYRAQRWPRLAYGNAL